MPPRRPTALTRALRPIRFPLPGRATLPSRATLRGAGLVAGVLVVATVGGAAAGGWAPYEVGRGDSLWSLAAEHGTTVERIMTMNGLQDDHLRAGELLYLPGSHSGVPPQGQAEDASACSAGSPAQPCPPAPPGGHVVEPGESLSSLAAVAGMSVADLAARNGLAADEGLRIGQVLLVAPAPGVTSASAAALSADASAPAVPSADVSTSTSTGDLSAASAPAAGVTAPAGSAGSAGAAGSATSAAQPTSPVPPTSPAAAGAQTGLVGGTTGVAAPAIGGPLETQLVIRIEAARQGVDPALALAVASVESDFDPTAVSHVGAVGVMQLMPRTAHWLAGILGRPVDRSDPADNIAGGVAFLRFLLTATSGDVTTAVGGYYQGLDSVQRNGFFPDTQEYIGKVTARRANFAQAPQS